MTNAFNVPIPAHAEEVISGGKHIGYLWRQSTAPLSIDTSIVHLVQQVDRFVTMTLDGILISGNSRTRKQAVKSLKAGILRRSTKTSRVSRIRK